MYIFLLMAKAKYIWYLYKPRLESRGKNGIKTGQTYYDFSKCKNKKKAIRKSGQPLILM